MAEQLQAIQRRIKSIESTEKITNAMQLVAAAKLKQATNRYNYSHEHLEPLIGMLKKEIESAGLSTNRGFYSGDKDIAPSLTIVITGSKGMCGSYNSSILKELDSVEAMTTFLPMGSKGYEHIKSRGMYLLGEEAEGDATYSDSGDIGSIDFKGLYEKPSEEHSYSEILNLSKYIVAKQQDGELSEVHIVYASYRNSMVYDIVNKMLISVYNIEENSDNSGLTAYIAEFLALSLYSIISEATLNEYGARRLAMKNATDNAEEMLAGLETKYHRARQSQITDELIEIISGTESQREIDKKNEEYDLKRKKRKQK